MTTARDVESRIADLEDALARVEATAVALEAEADSQRRRADALVVSLEQAITGRETDRQAAAQVLAELQARTTAAEQRATAADLAARDRIVGHENLVQELQQTRVGLRHADHALTLQRASSDRLVTRLRRQLGLTATGEDEGA